MCSLSLAYAHTHRHTHTHTHKHTHTHTHTSYKVTPLLQNDKKLAKAAPIFVQMLKSETRPETADAVLIECVLLCRMRSLSMCSCQVRDLCRMCSLSMCS
jgi:hypothetical protein